MRQSLKSLALAVVFAAAQASAQTAAPVKAAKSAAQPAGDEESPGGPPEGSVEIAPPAGGNANLGTSSSHTVEKGDTLWDLSNRYLGSPWYWPKVWSYNPEIANPHWIYPGNQVRFVGSGEEVPTQVEVGDAPEAMEAPIDQGDGVQVSGPLTYRPRGSTMLRVRQFVTAKELEETGKITGSFAQSERLTFPDTAYVTFKKQGDVRVGAKYLVFRTGTEIEHPTTGDTMGYLTTLLGEVRVLKVHESQKLVTVQVLAAWDEIQRGDLVGPSNEPTLKQVPAPRPNAKDLKGVIVTSVPLGMTMMAEHTEVVIDLGTDQGVQPGNTFTVIRQLEGLDERAMLHPEAVDTAMPVEDIGTCIAVEVKSKASTCLVTRALREFVRGDRVQMRAGGSMAAR